MEKQAEIGSIYATPCDTSSDFLKQHPKLRDRIGVDMVIERLESDTIDAPLSKTTARLETCMEARFATQTPMDLDALLDPEFVGYILSSNRERNLNLDPNIDRSDVDEQGLKDFLSATCVEVGTRIFGKTPHGDPDSNYTWLESIDREMVVPLFVSLNKAMPFDKALNHIVDLTEKRLSELPPLKDRFDEVLSKMATLIVQEKSISRNEKLLAVIDDFDWLRGNLGGISGTLTTFRSLTLTMNESKFLSTLETENNKSVYEAFQVGKRYPNVDSENQIYEDIYKNVETIVNAFPQFNSFSKEVLTAAREDIPTVSKMINKKNDEKDTDYVKRIRSLAEGDWNDNQNELRHFLQEKITAAEAMENPKLILDEINRICDFKLSTVNDVRELESRQSLLTQDATAALLENRNPRLRQDLKFLDRRTRVFNPYTYSIEEWVFVDGGMRWDKPIDEIVGEEIDVNQIPRFTEKQYDDFSKMMLVMGRV